MKVLQVINACIAIGANIIYCISLYIYLAYFSKFISIRYSNDLNKGDEIELTYIFFALLVPLMISIIISSISLFKKKGWKELFVCNVAFSIFFIFFTSMWFLFILSVYLGMWA